MRKYLRIFVVVFAFVFLLRSYLPVEINEEDEFYIFIAFTAFATPFCIYEIIQVLKDDKKNNTNYGKKRKIAATIVGVVIILWGYISSSINQP